jgi:hypothetical protein
VLLASGLTRAVVCGRKSKAFGARFLNHCPGDEVMSSGEGSAAAPPRKLHPKSTSFTRHVGFSRPTGRTRYAVDDTSGGGGEGDGGEGGEGERVAVRQVSAVMPSPASSTDTTPLVAKSSASNNKPMRQLA